MNVFFPPEMVLGFMDTRQSHDFKSTLFLVSVNTYLFCPKKSYYRTIFPYWQYMPSVVQLMLLVCIIILVQVKPVFSHFDSLSMYAMVIDYSLCIITVNINQVDSFLSFVVELKCSVKLLECLLSTHLPDHLFTIAG